MEIKVENSDDVTILRLRGRFVAGQDGPQCREKIKELIAAGQRKLLLDFSGVPHIDSTGLGFLTGCRTTASEAGAGLVLVSLNQRVRRVLDEVKLSQFFVIAENEASGMARLREIAAS